MTQVWTSATMSLDGYIAGPNETGFDQLFKWYTAGDIEVPTAHPDLTFRLTEAGAKHMRESIEPIGVLVVGRKLWDLMDGWGGRHPLDKHMIVVTHRPPDPWPAETEHFSFVTEGGVEAAIAKAKERAGDQVVGLNAGTIAQQALDAGLLDEVWIDLAPVLLGGGVRYFPDLASAPAELEGPISVVEDTDVTHLRYRVRRKV
jgi:dihydrofolate reductase